MRGGSDPEEKPIDATTIDLGLVFVPEDSTAPDSSARLALQVQQTLSTRYDAVTWRVTVLDEGPGAEPPIQAYGEAPLQVTHVLKSARRRLLAHDSDAVVVVSARPLSLRGRAVQAYASPVQQCAVLATDPQSAAERRVMQGVVDLVAALWELDEAGDDEVDDILRAIATTNEEPHAASTSRSPVRLLRVVPRVARQVLAARPWLMVRHLSRTLIGASAGALLALVTPDTWLLADSMGVARMAVLTLLVLVVALVVLVVGGNLRERATGRQQRAQVRVHNLAVWLSVSIAVLTLYGVLVVANLLATLLVLPGSLVAETVGHPADVPTLLRIAAVTAMISLIGSVFGAGLEDDEDVAEAAYSGSDDTTYDDRT